MSLSFQGTHGQPIRNSEDEKDFASLSKVNTSLEHFTMDVVICVSKVMVTLERSAGGN